MDAERFDRIAKSLAARASRRRLLRGLAAVGLGSGVLGPNGAGARRAPGGADGVTIEATDKVCKGQPAFSNKLCPVSPCGGDTCFCGVSVSGHKKCVDLSGLGDCPTEVQCDRNRDCGPGQVCIKFGGCCGTRNNLCAPACG
jgi:hypothetical protein